jgi:hypothetical protein
MHEFPSTYNATIKLLSHDHLMVMNFSDLN